jgi:hypothetical protein
VDSTVVGAFIGFGGSTVTQLVAGRVAGRRERRQINEGRLRELAQLVDEADRALTEGQHHVNVGLSVAKKVGAAGPPAIANDRWEAEREEARVQTNKDLNALWRYSNLLRLRVAEDHQLLRSFEGAVRNLEQQTTAMAELLEVGSERFQRKPAWDIASTARGKRLKLSAISRTPPVICSVPGLSVWASLSHCG